MKTIEQIQSEMTPALIELFRGLKLLADFTKPFVKAGYIDFAINHVYSPVQDARLGVSLNQEQKADYEAGFMIALIEAHDGENVEEKAFALARR